MCLVTTQRAPRTLRKDLITYKLVAKHKTFYRSYYIPKYRWEFNILNETDFTTTKEVLWFDGIAGKSFRALSANKNLRFKFIEEGFHSALNIERFNKSHFNSYDHTFTDEQGNFGLCIIVKCLIPKGSKVYFDKTGLVASNKMIILEEVNIEKNGEE